jgi:hypothetical protein
MAKTVVGLFDNFTDAQNVVQELTSAGFARDDISLLANDQRGEYSRAVGDTGESATGEGAAAGAIGGGVLGGVLGLLVGVGALAIPGIGPVLAAGPLAAALGTAGASTLVGAGIGAAAGGVIGALVGAGIPEEDANFYAEGVRRGGTLVMVKSSDDMANRAYDIMQRYGAVDIDKRGSEWRSSGWNRFDESATPYSSDADNKWERSSKVGTVGGAVAGAATGAAIGSVGGPVGTVVGGVAGAATGAGVGAAGDIAGESVAEGDTGAGYTGTTTGTTGTSRTYDTTAVSNAAGGSADDYFTRYDNDFRTHYQSYGASSGYTYDQYQPVYRYGYGLAADPAYRDYDWNRLEPEARRRWEERNPGTWENFKDSVRYAWERAKDAVS